MYKFKSKTEHRQLIQCTKFYLNKTHQLFRFKANYQLKKTKQSTLHFKFVKNKNWLLWSHVFFVLFKNTPEMSKCKAEHNVMKLPNYTKPLLISSQSKSWDAPHIHTRFAGNVTRSSVAPSFQSGICECGEWHLEQTKKKGSIIRFTFIKKQNQKKKPNTYHNTI